MINPDALAACREFDPQIFSDLYKDAYGFRPRMDLRDHTAKELDALWRSTAEAQGRAMREEKARESRAVAAFDALVDETIALGAGDYPTAVRWLLDAGGDEFHTPWGSYDLGYFLWHHGISEFVNCRRIADLAGIEFRR